MSNYRDMKLFFKFQMLPWPPMWLWWFLRLTKLPCRYNFGGFSAIHSKTTALGLIQSSFTNPTSAREGFILSLGQAMIPSQDLPDGVIYHKT